MLTAANSKTKEAQEILATDDGKLLVAIQDCRSSYVAESCTLETGPCRLVGAILNSNYEGSVLVIESPVLEIVLKTRIGTGASRPVFPLQPISCPGNLIINLTGANADAIIYWVPA